MKGIENNNDDIAINIKLKKGKDKFWFGDLSGGARCRQPGAGLRDSAGCSAGAGCVPRGCCDCAWALFRGIA